MTRFRNFLFIGCAVIALAASPALAQLATQSQLGMMGQGGMMGQQGQQPAEDQAEQSGQPSSDGGMMGGMMGGQGGMMGQQGQQPAEGQAQQPGQPPSGGGMMGGMMGGEEGGMMGCPMMGGMMGGGKGMKMGMGGMMMHSVPMMEARLAYIKADLEITEAQMPAWDAYADAVRARLKSMEPMHEETMKAKESGNALERMDARIKAMQAKLDGLKALQAPTEALYAVLTAAQKKKADQLLGGCCGMM